MAVRIAFDRKVAGRGLLKKLVDGKIEAAQVGAILLECCQNVVVKH